MITKIHQERKLEEKGGKTRRDIISYAANPEENGLDNSDKKRMNVMGECIFDL